MARSRSPRASALVVVMSLSAAGLLAQTGVKPPKNSYTPQQDVELGREAAAEVRQQYPIIEDERITSYLARLGDRLVAAAPPELKQSVYEYSFTPVNLKEINAFALPGGPMFVHRGMFDAAAAKAKSSASWRTSCRTCCFVMAPPTRPRRRTPGCSSVRLPASSAARSWAGGWIGHRARQPVRTRHAAPEIQPRLREAGRSARRADHGARRLRPARARAHVRDDRA